MENFLVNNGGTMDSAILIEIKGEYLKLKVNVDIQLLNNLTKHLSINAMNVLRVWLSQFCTLPKSFLIAHPPHLWGIVKNWSKKKGESKDNVVPFLNFFLKVPLFVKDLIIPLHEANHWNIIVMNIDQLLH